MFINCLLMVKNPKSRFFLYNFLSKQFLDLNSDQRNVCVFISLIFGACFKYWEKKKEITKTKKDGKTQYQTDKVNLGHARPPDNLRRPPVAMRPWDHGTILRQWRAMVIALYMINYTFWGQDYFDFKTHTFQLCYVTYFLWKIYLV